MESIKNLLTLLNNKYILYGIIALLIVIFIKDCNSNKSLERDLKISQQNLEAAKDTIKKETTKSGKLLFSINSYISTEKDLKKLNMDLFNQVNEQKGDVVSLSNAIVVLKQDKDMLQKYIDSVKTHYSKPISLGNGVYDIPWLVVYSYDSKNRDQFTGMTKIKVNKGKDSINLVEHIKTTFIDRESMIDLSFGQKVENGGLRVFVESAYPGFSAESLKGVLIDPNSNTYIKSLIKKRNWFPNTFSFGIGITGGYDFFKGAPSFVVGPTFTYNIYSW